MHVLRLTVGDLQTNCYLFHGEETAAAVVDPGDDAPRILRTAEERGLTITHILLTHVHADHMLAAAEVREATGAALLVPREDAPALADPRTSLMAMLFPGRGKPMTADRLLDDGDVVEIGGMPVRVMHTPGHTPGSCCYLCGDVIFSGDTLFQGSAGRTDFPGGDSSLLYDSLRRLAACEGDAAVLPGHGPDTTLEAERKGNPFLLEDFD